jgi:hypothetical protein
MKGFFSFILVVVLMGFAFFAGQAYYEQNHSYVSDHGINFSKVVDDTESGVENLVDSVSDLF